MFSTKTTWDITQRIRDPLQKVNFRQYLKDKAEPVEVPSGKTSITLDKESGIIQDTYIRKRILRNFARKLRNR